MRDLRWRVFLDPRLRHSRAPAHDMQGQAGGDDGIKLLQ